MDENYDDSNSDGLIIDDNVVRIQLRKPYQNKWELRTRNLSSAIRFPTVQLFDCDGNLLIETNDENISIKSSDFNHRPLEMTQSLRERDFKYYMDTKCIIRKHNTISGDKIYTRVYRAPLVCQNNSSVNTESSYLIKDDSSIFNIPNKSLNYGVNSDLQQSSLETTPFQSDIALSEISSYKSSDNEDNYENQETDEHRINEEGSQESYSENIPTPSKLLSTENTLLNEGCSSTKSVSNDKFRAGIHRTQSLYETTRFDKSVGINSRTILRSNSEKTYDELSNNISILSTYIKSLRARKNSDPDWLTLYRNHVKKLIHKSHISTESQKLPECASVKSSLCRKSSNSTTDSDSFNIPTDIAADFEIKRRLKMYRRGMSEIEPQQPSVNLVRPEKRRHSVIGTIRLVQSSSSESVDEADWVLNRLKRRILKNKSKEKKRRKDAKFLFDQSVDLTRNDQDHQDAGVNVAKANHLSQSMGSNISQHSNKGLKGRRARSSGDLCNGDTKSQSESSVCGSVVGDVMGWNRSLPNHLDGNRHLMADYSRVSNYSGGEFGNYNRTHPKSGRGLRYRVSKSGSNAEPVWMLQDQGLDQGYGSERSPEDDYVPPIAPAPLPAVSLENYEAELRSLYPFINEENTFTVVVEKDGRGLGMSVCGGGGLVKIRRLYPPQPAWRTGRLAPKDLILAANGVPLAGLTTYEALEVLRTAPPRVELRVCRPPLDEFESITPPDPPTPPVRTPLPPHQLAPMDPLNCHPMHARLSQTTSSATTSSSEGRGRRDASPEPDRRDLRLPDLNQALPVYNIQYGEFDIVMTKVNGSLGFTLRKEDHSALGHYVRALVREPALSDGRIQPGDRIVAVNDTSMSNMSHADAVAFLRACGSEVRLRLYRDHAATPVSPISPKEEMPVDSDTPSNRPKPPLRAEAVSMLCDLAARRLTPDATDGSRSPCLSPRKFRRLTKDNNHYEPQHDKPTHSTTSIDLEIYTTMDRIVFGEKTKKFHRAQSMTLLSGTQPTNCRKQKLSLTVPPHGYELNNLDNDTLDAPNFYQEDKTLHRHNEPDFPVDSDEPVSMPVDLSSDEKFKHSNPVYQSAVLHTATNENSSECRKEEGNGLKKWKGVALSPDDECKPIIEPLPVPKQKQIEIVQKENVKPTSLNPNTTAEPTIVTVELNRGWNSRLGFSVQSHPESGQSYISAVYNDSVAARDGRLRRGDVILQVNDENVTSMRTSEVIELLRLLRGSICITVLRPPAPPAPPAHHNPHTLPP